MRAVAIFSILVFGLLSACTTEEGVEKHMKKGSEEGAMLNEDTSKDMKNNSASAVGMAWEAAVAEAPGSAAEPLGTFATRNECKEQAMAHIKKQGYGNAWYSCSR